MRSSALCHARVGRKMEGSQRHGVDSAQVKKAVQALLAYQKSKEKGNKLLLNENDRILLMVTVWKIPNRPEVIRIPLPHGIRPDSCEVCLFTKDEPNMSSDQTEKFYKKLFAQHGITNINEIIPYKRLKTEYKPYEAKRRLLGSFDLFLSDSRIRRLLPSHLGKHFYKEKREPQSVNLKSKGLASELNRFIQGTQLHVTNKGCCYSIRMGHTGMKAEDIVENAVAVAEVLAEKLPMKWKNVKVLHLKTQKSVSLPIYNSPIDIIKDTQAAKSQKDKLKKKKKKPAKKKKSAASKPKNKSEQATSDQDPGESAESEEEDVPELVPISEPDGTTSLCSSKTPEKKIKAGEKITASTPKESGKKRKISDIDEPKTPKNKKNNEEAKTPSKNKKECNKEAKTPSKYIEEPNEEPKTPSKNKKECNKQAKTPSQNIEEPKPPSKNTEEPNEEPKSPSMNDDDQVPEHENGGALEQESVPKPGNLRKTPKKASGKSATRLAKSAKKAPLTPKLKKKKLMSPKSV